MKKPVGTTNAPAAIGPYAQANVVGNLVFVSGQMGLNPESGLLAEGVEEQAKQALNNIRAILEAAGSSLDKVVKTTCFIKNMDDFAKMNAVYGSYFTEGAYPSRSAIEVSRLPKDALIEIEVIAEA